MTETCQQGLTFLVVNPADTFSILRIFSLRTASLPQKKMIIGAGRGVVRLNNVSIPSHSFVYPLTVPTPVKDDASVTVYSSKDTRWAYFHYRL